MSRPVRYGFVLVLCMIAGVAGATESLRLVLSKDMPASQLFWSWDARAPNVIYVINDAWDGAIFDIHIFEEILVPAPDWPAKHFNANRKIDESLFEWTRDGNAYRFHIRQLEVVNFEMNGIVRTEGQRLIVEGQTTNHTAFSWGATQYEIGLMCFRCRHSTDFYDLEGRRIDLFDVRTGAATSLYDLVGAGQYFNYFLTLPPTTWANRLRKANNTRRRMVTMETTPCATLGGNRENGICCIHANVNLKAKPGETSSWVTTVDFEEIIPSGAREWVNYE